MQRALLAKRYVDTLSRFAGEAMPFCEKLTVLPVLWTLMPVVKLSRLTQARFYLGKSELRWPEQMNFLL